MPEVRLEIGGRSFPVVCQEGEEAQLARAAALLDREAQGLAEQLGRIPEPRMLLLAGLLLADRMLEADERIRLAEARATALAREVEQARTAAAPEGPSAEVLAEVEAEAQRARDALDRTASRLEEMAEMLEAL